MAGLEDLAFVNEDGRPIYTLGEGLGQLRSLRDLKYVRLNRVGLSAAGKKRLAASKTSFLSLLMGRGTTTPWRTSTRLKRLGGLHLSGSKITDAGLVHLRKLPNLYYLTLQEVAITDDGLRHLEGLGIEELALPMTQISDRGIIHLARMPALVRLNLALTGVTDAAIPDLAKLKNLRALCLSGTSVSDAGCRKLRNALPNLKYLVDPSAAGSIGF